MNKPVLNEPSEDRLLQRVRKYVEHETPSGNAERCSALADVIASDLRELGAQVTLIPAPGMGQHVLAEIPGSAPHILVLGHLDTVHPIGTLERQPFAIAGDRVTGPGVFDMKSGVSLMIEAIAELRRANRKINRALRVLISCDEEVGSHTSRTHIESNALGARAVLVPEPSLPGGRAKTQRKGVATYQLTIRGRAAHAGIEPERGISAITELAHQVLAIQSMAAPEQGTTVSVGTIRGGTTSNVIPAEAHAAIDVRFARASEGERVHAAMSALSPHTQGVTIEVDRVDTRPPLERSAGVIALYQEARAIATELGFDLAEGSTGGGSDGCLTAAIGIPTLDGLGPQGGGAHASDEHVLLADLPFRLKFFAALLERL